MKKIKTLKEAANLIKEAQVQFSDLEDWVGDFIEELSDNLETVLTLNWLILDAIREAQGLKAKGEDKYLGEYKAEAPLFYRYLMDNKDHYGAEEIKKLEKVEKFFEDFSV